MSPTTTPPAPVFRPTRTMGAAWLVMWSLFNTPLSNSGLSVT